MKYNYSYKNKILFRYGQKAETFYISLRGRLAVLIPEEEKIELSEEEYMRFLIKLKKNDEHEVLAKTLEANKKIYSITEFFESWFDNKFYKSLSFRKSIIEDIQEYNKLNEMRQTQFEEDDTYETIEEYILENRPDKDPGKQDRKQVTIYTYHHIHNLITGSKFGDVAFQKPSQKRSATILTIDDCHLAIYSKKFYDDWLLKIDDSNTKLQLNFFATIPLFTHMNKALFQRHYFYLFSRTQILRGDKVIIEGNEPDYIYFLKEGEYELSFRKSILELTDLIENFSGIKKDIFENFYLSGKFFINS
jgi:CRP-like cAMP-binding protein